MFTAAVSPGAMFAAGHGASPTMLPCPASNAVTAPSEETPATLG
jgi:hypothetical protein